MVIRFSSLLPVVALAAVVAAGATGSECNTGGTQCCDNTYASNDPTATSILSALGVSIPNVSGQVGFGCTAVTGIGASSGGNCASQPVCCSSNQFNGLINFGCGPVTGSG